MRWDVGDVCVCVEKFSADETVGVRGRRSFGEGCFVRNVNPTGGFEPYRERAWEGCGRNIITLADIAFWEGGLILSC